MPNLGMTGFQGMSMPWLNMPPMNQWMGMQIPKSPTGAPPSHMGMPPGVSLLPTAPSFMAPPNAAPDVASWSGPAPSGHATMAAGFVGPPVASAADATARTICVDEEDYETCNTPGCPNQRPASHGGYCRECRRKWHGAHGSKRQDGAAPRTS